MVGLIEEQNVEANFMANKNLSFGFTPLRLSISKKEINHE